MLLLTTTAAYLKECTHYTTAITPRASITNTCISVQVKTILMIDSEQIGKPRGQITAQPNYQKSMSGPFEVLLKNIPVTKSLQYSGLIQLLFSGFSEGRLGGMFRLASAVIALEKAKHA